MAQPIFKLVKPKPDGFGGKEFWENFFAVGQLEKECPSCHHPDQVQAQ